MSPTIRIYVRWKHRRESWRFSIWKSEDSNLFNLITRLYYMYLHVLLVSQSINQQRCIKQLLYVQPLEDTEMVEKKSLPTSMLWSSWGTNMWGSNNYSMSCVQIEKQNKTKQKLYWEVREKHCRGTVLASQWS